MPLFRSISLIIIAAEGCNLFSLFFFFLLMPFWHNRTKNHPELKHCEVSRATNYVCFVGFIVVQKLLPSWMFQKHTFCQNSNWGTRSTSAPFPVLKNHHVKVLYISICSSGTGSLKTIKQHSNQPTVQSALFWLALQLEDKCASASHYLLAKHDDIGRYLHKVTICHQLRRTSRTKANFSLRSITTWKLWIDLGLFRLLLEHNIDQTPKHHRSRDTSL